LYSPPITRALKKRKQFYDELMVNGSNDNNNKQLVSSTTSTANYTFGNKKSCVVCNKNGLFRKSFLI